MVSAETMSTGTDRTRDRATWQFLVIAASLFVLLLSANLPTPLYAGYEQRFGFSRTVLTLIFATYALVLVPSLMLFGQLSDRIGRRPVITLGARRGDSRCSPRTTWPCWVRSAP